MSTTSTLVSPWASDWTEGPTLTLCARKKWADCILSGHEWTLTVVWSAWSRESAPEMSAGLKNTFTRRNYYWSEPKSQWEAGSHSTNCYLSWTIKDILSMIHYKNSWVYFPNESFSSTVIKNFLGNVTFHHSTVQHLTSLRKMNNVALPPVHTVFNHTYCLFYIILLPYLHICSYYAFHFNHHCFDVYIVQTCVLFYLQFNLVFSWCCCCNTIFLKG